jgi:hypothetical protein
MKKLILFLAVVFTSITTFSQADINTNYSYSGWWNPSKNNFEWEDKTSTSIKFTFRGDTIYSSDKGISFYKVIKLYPTDSTERFKIIKSECKDEKGIFCSFSIKIYSDSDKYVIIMYEKLCYIYHIDD